MTQVPDERDQNQAPQPRAEPEPFELEPPDEPEAAADEAHADETASDADRPVAPAGEAGSDVLCPSCGAPMPGEETIVCLRCGFDLKTSRPLTTAVVGDDEGEDEDEAAGVAAREPIARRAAGSAWVAMATAGALGVLLLLGHLFGAPGLFADEAVARTAEGVEVVPWRARLAGVARLVVQAAVTFGCVVGGLLALAQLEERPVGEWRLLLWRSLALALAVRLPTLLDLPPAGLEVTAEVVMAAAIFVGGALLLFRLPLRLAATAAGLAVLIYLALLAAASAVLWSA